MLRVISVFFALIVSIAAASAQTTPDSRLKSIADSKTIRIAYRTDATPFAFADQTNQPSGYSVDLCQLVTKSIADQIGVSDLTIQWVPVTVQTRFDAITGGKADMECGSSSVTLGRMKDVDFSNYTFVESTGVLVTRSSNIHGLADMAGKRIAVISGTTNEMAVKEQDRLHKLGLALVEVKDRDEAIAALEGGKADGYASDKLLLLGSQLKHPEALTMLGDDLSIEPYAIALPRGDWAMRLAVNTALAHIYRSGVVKDIFNKWFGPLGLQPGLLLGAIYALGSLPD
jgi:glutamate/aspartate transport system substrate-binding protein